MPGARVATPRSKSPSNLNIGLMFAVGAATCYGINGPLCRPLLEAGWSASSIVLVRLAIAGVINGSLGLYLLRGQWHLLGRNLRVIGLYGAANVCAQVCYVSAVQHLEVGPALMIMYLAPAAVVIWLWVAHRQRPSPVTLVGSLFAGIGMMLVLDIVSGGVAVDPAGVMWALGSMVGVATYYVLSADQRNGLPPAALTGFASIVGVAGAGAVGLSGLVPFRLAHGDVAYAGLDVPWWLPLAVLGFITASLGTVLGVSGGRRLGSRLASFVGLLEVVAGVLFAWLLLGELPDAIQFVGGALILVGCVCVKLGEPVTTPDVA